MITCFQRKQSQRVYFTIILIFSCYKKLKNIFTIMFFFHNMEYNNRYK